MPQLVELQSNHVSWNLSPSGPYTNPCFDSAESTGFLLCACVVLDWTGRGMKSNNHTAQSESRSLLQGVCIVELGA